MIDIPPDVQIRATLRAGSVCYFSEETHSTDTPHYFVVLNPSHSPIKSSSLPARHLRWRRFGGALQGFPARWSR
jgi:hypothetical protein